MRDDVCLWRVLWKMGLLTMKTAFITGANGQDGSYLSELLLSKGYQVHGMVRRSSVFTTERIDHIWDHPDFTTHHGDLTDPSNLIGLLSSIKPDEIYNLGAQSHVAVSFEVPDFTAQVTGVGTIRLLDAMRTVCPQAKFYQASTSELFGGLPETVPQNECTAFYPKSPYGAAKLYAYWITRNYRESYNLFAANGILFNHESPRRGKTFVTKKVTRAVAKIHLGLQSHIELGNLDSKRDWGHAKDYAEAMWLMLQSETPKDYVVATGVSYTIRELCEIAFANVGIDLIWSGTDLDEVGVCAADGRVLVKVDPKYFRPLEVDFLLGDPKLIKNDLGWAPTVSFTEMINEMIEFDMQELKSVL